MLVLYFFILFFFFFVCFVVHALYVMSVCTTWKRKYVYRQCFMSMVDEKLVHYMFVLLSVPFLYSDVDLPFSSFNGTWWESSFYLSRFPTLKGCKRNVFDGVFFLSFEDLLCIYKYWNLSQLMRGNMWNFRELLVSVHALRFSCALCFSEGVQIKINQFMFYFHN